MYDIARYFPLEARRRACGYYYTNHQHGTCPLGIMLHELDPDCHLMRPLSYQVAARLPDYPYDEVRAAAEQFIDSWDMDRIRDLRTALGVPPSVPPIHENAAMDQP